jgi:hypothetical protein
VTVAVAVEALARGVIPFTIALVAIGVLMLVALVAIAREGAQGPTDVAVAYEEAWDRLDFGSLFDLSGTELRDGQARAEFVASKRAAHAETARRPATVVSVENVDEFEDAAFVTTRLVAGDGELRNRMQLARRGGRWVVVAYALADA